MKKIKIGIVSSVFFLSVLLIIFGYNQFQPKNNASEASVAMVNIIRELSQAISKEIHFFESQTTMDTYESFVMSLDNDFNTLEEAFTKIHQQVIEDMNVEQRELVVLFVQLMDYHYLILEKQVAYTQFEQTVNELTGFIEAGEITSNSYNQELELLMQNYGDLMNYSALMDGKVTTYKDKTELKNIIELLNEVQERLEQMDVQSKEDRYVHNRIKQMFDYVEQGITAVYAYSHDEALIQINTQGIIEYTNMRLSIISNASPIETG